MIPLTSPLRFIFEFFAQLAADHNYWGIVCVLSGPILLAIVGLIDSIVTEAKANRREHNKDHKSKQLNA